MVQTGELGLEAQEQAIRVCSQGCSTVSLTWACLIFDHSIRRALVDTVPHTMWALLLLRVDMVAAGPRATEWSPGLSHSELVLAIRCYGQCPVFPPFWGDARLQVHLVQEACLIDSAAQ